MKFIDVIYNVDTCHDNKAPDKLTLPHVCEHLGFTPPHNHGDLPQFSSYWLYELCGPKYGSYGYVVLFFGGMIYGYAYVESYEGGGDVEITFIDEKVTEMARDFLYVFFKKKPINYITDEDRAYECDSRGYEFISSCVVTENVILKSDNKLYSLWYDYDMYKHYIVRNGVRCYISDDMVLVPYKFSERILSRI